MTDKNPLDELVRLAARWAEAEAEKAHARGRMEEASEQWKRSNALAEDAELEFMKRIEIMKEVEEDPSWRTSVESARITMTED